MRHPLDRRILPSLYRSSDLILHDNLDVDSMFKQKFADYFDCGAGGVAIDVSG